MARESIKVTTQDLRNMSATVSNDANDYYVQYQEFLDHVRTFTATDYLGDDADEFRSAVESFEGDFRKMKELMDEYAAFLKNTAQSYEDAADNAKQQASALRQS